MYTMIAELDSTSRPYSQILDFRRTLQLIFPACLRKKRFHNIDIRSGIEKPKLEFPKLSKGQREFGVNPAYQPEPAAPVGEPVAKTSTNGEILFIVTSMGISQKSICQLIIGQIKEYC